MGKAVSRRGRFGKYGELKRKARLRKSRPAASRHPLGKALSKRNRKSRSRKARGA